MRYVKCLCGLTDGHDDTIVSRELVDVTHNADEAIIKETRVCDICQKKYSVLMHYKFSYEAQNWNG